MTMLDCLSLSLSLTYTQFKYFLPSAESDLDQVPALPPPLQSPVARVDDPQSRGQNLLSSLDKLPLLSCQDLVLPPDELAGDPHPSHHQLLLLLVTGVHW